MKKTVFMLCSLAIVTVNADSYKCMAKDGDVIHIRIQGSKIQMRDEYGKFKGSLNAGTYYFGHGTGTIKVVNKRRNTITILRDDNVNERYFSCKKIK